ncbi:NAD(P)H-binding protein [Arthrobacter sp. JSM 101049]|uniref:NAD(P)H-binding protein n=1 Tax=Arthrobacter sp. JSM 101049 TaxID=929097 RepID=UPI0035640C9C
MARKRTHGSTTSERDLRDNDYAGVTNILRALEGRSVRIILMTAIGVTRPGMPYTQWKLRSERLVRASGQPYTIVRPGWFDYNQTDQRRIVMLQGDRRQSGTPADGVIARDQISRVLVDSLSAQAADRKTFELIADLGAEQEDRTAVFESLSADSDGELDATEYLEVWRPLDIAFRGQRYCQWGPVAAALGASGSQRPALTDSSWHVHACCGCLPRPRWCRARCGP